METSVCILFSVTVVLFVLSAIENVLEDARTVELTESSEDLGWNQNSSEHLRTYFANSSVRSYLIDGTEDEWKSRRCIRDKLHATDLGCAINCLSKLRKKCWQPRLNCKNLYLEKYHIGYDAPRYFCEIGKLSTLTRERPLVYSLGSNNLFSFETSIYEYLKGNVDIYTFSNERPSQLTSKPSYVNYRQEVFGKNRTLTQVHNEIGNNGRSIHILKIDVEGYEGDIIDDLTRGNNCALDIWHLNMETHWNSVYPIQKQAQAERDLSEKCGLEKFFQAENRLFWGFGEVFEVGYVKIDWKNIERLFGRKIDCCSS